MAPRRKRRYAKPPSPVGIDSQQKPHGPAAKRHRALLVASSVLLSMWLAALLMLAMYAHGTPH